MTESRTCERCGHEFTVTSKSPHQRSCSLRCAALARPRLPEADRFWSKVDKDGPVPAHRPDLGPCWLWTAARTHGYGRFGVTHCKMVPAHKWAYESVHGPLRPGVELDHAFKAAAQAASAKRSS